MKLFDLKKDDYFCFKADLRTELVLPVYRVIREYDSINYDNIKFFNIRTGSNIFFDSNPEVHKLELELKWRFADDNS